VPRGIVPPLLLILMAGACWVLVTPWVAERLLFFPDPRDPGPAPRLGGIDGADVWLEGADGVQVHGWWYSASTSAPAVLLLHGNAGNIAGRTGLAAGYLARGISVFLLDYRGYGRSGGTPSESGVYRDAEAALDHLAAEVGLERLVVHGRSLGGAVAAGALKDRRVAGVILDSTFTSLPDMARAAYPFVPRFALRPISGSFDTRSRIREIRVPLLVVHGSRDEIVPPWMGRELFTLAEGTKSWWAIEGAGHNDVLLLAGEVYLDRLARFVRDVVEG
jgi:uncharacterized protein